MSEEFAETHGWVEAEGDDYLTDEQLAERLKDAPVPLLWRVLLRPRPPKRKSAGGLYLPGQAQDAEAHLNYVGQVVAIGPEAGKSEKFGDSWKIKVGDWVVYGRYVGQRMTHKDVRLLMVDDDQIQGVLSDPYALKIYT